MEALAAAERGTLEKVYYLTGDQSYWAWQWIFRIRRRVLGDMKTRDGFVIIDEQSVSWADVSSFLQSPSLFSSGRVVLIREGATWKTKEADVASWLPKALEGTCLIIWDKKSVPGLVKLLGAHRVLDLKPLKAPIFLRFVESTAKSQKVKLGRGVAEVLAHMLDANEYQVEQELEKMALYDAKCTWDEDAVRNFALPLRGTAFWQLGDAVVRKKRAQSLTALEELLREGNEPLPILVMVARQLIQMGRVLDAKDRGIPASLFAQQEGLKEFVVSRLYQSAKSWTKEQVGAGLREAERIDRAIKLSLGDPEIWLSTWIALI